MKYVVIVGGQLRNKGAQAMTFKVVDEMKRKYPQKEIILFASVFNEKEKEKASHLNFKILEWPLRTKMKFLKENLSVAVGMKNYLKYLVKGPGKTKEELKEIEIILENTDLMLDVSGFALSSQRGYNATLSYLYNIIIAKKYNIRMILLPQSFGPFEYTKKQKKTVFPLIKKYLSYPDVIYARETEGLNHLEAFNLKNLKSTYDIVLQTRHEYNLSHIYNFDVVKPQNREIDIQKNSVAVVPNEKIMISKNIAKQYEIYKEIINILLAENKNVYLLVHSNEDKKICENIKKEYKETDEVILVNDEFDCVQMEQVISQFDFVIASRYHSIIHAYKKSVPALVFGWAVKYQELLESFSQRKYLFDVREDVEMKEIIKMVKLMLQNYNDEASIIEKKKKECENENLFDEIKI